MHERNSRSSILQPLFMMIGAILLIIYLVGALNTGNWLWFLPIQPTYVPSRIVIRDHGQVTEYRPEDPEFAIVKDSLDDAFSDFSNLDLVPIGLSEGTLQEYNQSSVVMEVYYPQPIRFNTIVRMSNVNQLLIPIEGRHSGYRYLFPGSNGQWLTGAFVMEDEQPIYDTLRRLGFIEQEAGVSEKTQAMRALEGKRISYDVLTYPDSMRDAEEIAGVLNLPRDAVFKTLVVLPPNPGKKPLLVMVPANKQLDTKKLAEAIGAKKVKLATHKEAEQLTGLQVGGISAVALLNKPFTVYIDESAGHFAHIYVSAGKRGMQLKVGVSDLIKLTNARSLAVSGEV